MPRCFVIQPFDGGKFDKRYVQTFKPAIEAAGLEAYRTDRDYSVDVPIEAIEEGIKSAAICLADITTNNPNVWYELGFASASGRPVVMICSDERAEDKFPFDIQHRSILRYQTQAQGDFAELQSGITERLTALLAKGETLRQMAEEQQIAPVSGLSQPELTVLAVMAGSVVPPRGTMSFYDIKTDAEKAGLNAVAVNFGIMRLKIKGFIEPVTEQDRNDYDYTAFALTDSGWGWMEQHEAHFVLRVRPKENDFATGEISDDDIPF